MDATDRRNRAGTEAAHWFVRLQSEDMERSEREQFVDWLRESHIHIAEMLRVAQVHGALEQFDRWARISTGPETDGATVVQLPSPPDKDSPPRLEGEGPRARLPRSRRMRLFAVAATLATLFVTTSIVVPKIRGQVIETERGERREVVLNDGSVVQVDPQTRLRVKYVDAVRRVFLEHGRAVFHVAKNANRPFLVQADGTTVRAVGTAFGVERQPQGIVVTVAEGRVAVVPTTAVIDYGLASKPENIQPQPLSSKKTGPAQREVAAPGEGPLFLTANQQVTVRRSGSAEPVREVDSQRELAWAEGRLIFHNDDVGKVIAQFNRYNRVQLSVTDSALASRPVSGVFNASEPEAFIEFLQTVVPVDIARDHDKSITIGSPRPP